MSNLDLTTAIAKLKSYSVIPATQTTSQQLTNWEAMTSAEKNAWIAESNRLKTEGCKTVNKEPFAPTLIGTGTNGARLVLGGLDWSKNGFKILTTEIQFTISNQPHPIL